MLMLCKGTEVPRSALASIPTPQATATWRPLPHAEVIETLIDRAGRLGLRVKNEKYAVMPGRLYPEEGMQIELDGGRMFGSIDFDPIPGVPFPDGCGPSAGIRNSHDKTFALSILSGARVFLCENGVLRAEHIISRKHTSGIDLIASIDDALNAFMSSIQDFNTMYEQMRDLRVNRTRAHSLIVEMARAGAFSSDLILPVVEEFENPRHAEFKERNVWNLYQSATETMKRQSPARQLDGFKALNATLMPLLN
ncbi:MAG: DUF932 domain-containing protein [Planctomycetota bacterium]